MTPSIRKTCSRVPSFNSATAVTPWMTTPPMTAARTDRLKLQFGHGGDAVDDAQAAESRPKRRKGFNSATAVTPWMTRYSVFSVPLRVSFNSATAVTPWMTLPAGEERAAPAGFNSATAVTPWMTRDEDGDPANRRRASIRPRR